MRALPGRYRAEEIVTDDNPVSGRPAGQVPSADGGRRWCCPRCTASLDDDRSFVAEYWIGNGTNFFVWCVGCGWRGEIVQETVLLVEAVGGSSQRG